MHSRKEKALLVAPRIWNRDKNYNYSIEELSLLVNTLGLDVSGTIKQNLKNINSSYFVGSGKAKQIVEQAKALNIDYIIFDEDLTPVQTKNFQKLNKNLKFIDRSGVILEIFYNNAKSKESKTQVELARLQYQLPRLTRMWTHLERQMGGFGTRAGAGETQIEVDRRILRKRISLLKKRLKRIDSEREVQSKKRKNFFRTSLVGYTNVGKSSLMKSLTKSDVLIRNQLFATLDTTVRRLFIGESNYILLSDTVGFIRNLPNNLIASFKSTLQEVVDSNLLLIILDANSSDLYNEIDTIQSVLTEIRAEKIPYQYVFNKIDLVDEDRIKYLKNSFPESIMVSASRSLQLSDIKKVIKDHYENWSISLKNPLHRQS
jgi:GTP-binding protein HflX